MFPRINKFIVNQDLQLLMEQLPVAMCVKLAGWPFSPCQGRCEMGKFRRQLFIAQHIADRPQWRHLDLTFSK